MPSLVAPSGNIASMPARAPRRIDRVGGRVPDRASMAGIARSRRVPSAYNSRRMSRSRHRHRHRWAPCALQQIAHGGRTSSAPATRCPPAFEQRHAPANTTAGARQARAWNPRPVSRTPPVRAATLRRPGNTITHCRAPAPHPRAGCPRWAVAGNAHRRQLADVVQRQEDIVGDDAHVARHLADGIEQGQRIQRAAGMVGDDQQAAAAGIRASAAASTV